MVAVKTANGVRRDGKAAMKPSNGDALIGQDASNLKHVTRQEGRQLLDRQARQYLGMSGTEFVQKYRAGEIDDPDRTEVVRVAMLIPFAQ